MLYIDSGMVLSFNFLKMKLFNSSKLFLGPFLIQYNTLDARGEETKKINSQYEVECKFKSLKLLFFQVLNHLISYIKLSHYQ